MLNNWQGIIVSPTATMRETIVVIETGALKLALVADNNCKLLGVVTDGDIRRALLKHKEMQTPISEIMNASPVVAEEGTTRRLTFDLMNKHSIHAIPLLKNDVVVGLETLQNIQQVHKYDNPIFLMAGGFGTRLKPLTNDCPKPLLKIGGKPILEIILESFISSGFHQFYISTHYLPENIKAHFGNGENWGVNIQYVHEDTPLGTGGALGLLPETLNDLPLIMMNGDVLTNVDFAELLNYHNQKKSICTMCVCEYEYQVPYGVIESEDYKVINMVEKPTYKYFVNAGIYVVDKELVKKVAKNEVIDMPTLIQNQMDNHENVSLFPLHEYWKDIGQINDFNQAQQDVRLL